MTSVKLLHSDSPVSITLRQDGSNHLLTDYIAERCPSLTGPEAVYSPTPYLFNGHLQTGYASYYNGSSSAHEVTYDRELLDLPDGGQIALDWTTGEAKKDTPTLVLLHGLTGGSHESYIRSVLEIIIQPPFRYRGVVINNRGCANSDITTPQLYNGAYTEDVRVALKHIQRTVAPGTPLIGIGFSLGSNILVKYLGEEGDKTPLCGAISVANPFDFERSSLIIDGTYWNRKVYSATLANNLKKAFGRHLDTLKESGKIDVDQILAAGTLREFDDACTRKLRDYDSVDAYYRDASSHRYIASVRVPLLCMNALDDPIAPAECIPRDEIKKNPYVILATTDYGGHLGWFEHIQYPTRWVSKPLAEFIVALFEANDIRESPQHIDPAEVDRSVEKIQA
ncbi:hypothetical protein DFQ28_010557 [Apophysomyces sp. BC1034]|nr:hypothetical protein DFQ30_001563 [Apophysomyces sp. BC1015]KAG0183526.1 hypothetical protein DFQ29_002580 [Apophysomyces sp. BC1021]KAG0194473.1 hypothetical protein DFQ28_010557 [Apophysomyces sp. BC1034]